VHKTESLELSFVLHSRPFRETSLIVDIFSASYGRLALCVRGARTTSGKGSSKQSLLQPLTPLFLGWKGRGDLPYLTQVEAAGSRIQVASEALYSLFYLNELLMRLLHRHDPQPELFHQYQHTLNQFKEGIDVEVALREFELTLLEVLGYGISFDCDHLGAPILPELQYLLDIDGQFQPIDENNNSLKKRQHSVLFKGSQLLSIASKKWQNTNTLSDAKRLVRLCLRPLIGDKPLNSRKLFRSKKVK